MYNYLITSSGIYADEANLIRKVMVKETPSIVTVNYNKPFVPKNIYGEQYGCGFDYAAKRRILDLGGVGSECNLYDQLTKKDIDDMLNHDVIYLPGGNTFDFAEMLNEYKLMPKLKEFAKTGLIVGASAGSIMITPTVQIANFADDNYANLTGNKLKAIGLTDYEIKPHWQSWKFRRQIFQWYADRFKVTIKPVCAGDIIVWRRGHIYEYLTDKAIVPKI